MTDIATAPAFATHDETLSALIKVRFSDDGEEYMSIQADGVEVNDWLVDALRCFSYQTFIE